MESSISKNIQEQDLKLSKEQEFGSDKDPFKVAFQVKKPSKVSKKQIKIILFLLTLLFLSAGLIYGVYYYLTNLTPDAIFKRSFGNFINDQNIKFKGTFKFTFLYSDKQEEINVSDIEVYSLLRKSASDSHEIEVGGVLDKSSNPAKMDFDLSWSVSGSNAFKIGGNLNGYDLSFKVTPYIFEETTPGRLKEDYTTIDLKDLSEKLFSDSTLSSWNAVKLDEFDFEITDTFPDDLINGQRSHHYKVRVIQTSGNFDQVELSDFDIWIIGKSKQIVRLKGSFELQNIGLEANNLGVQFDLKFE